MSDIGLIPVGAVRRTGHARAITAQHRRDRFQKVIAELIVVLVPVRLRQVFAEPITVVRGGHQHVSIPKCEDVVIVLLGHDRDRAEARGYVLDEAVDGKKLHHGSQILTSTRIGRS